MAAALRRSLIAVLALAGLAAVLTTALTHQDTGATPVRPAADVSQFDPGNIISDDVFYAGQAMSAAEVQAFIAVKEASCVVGSDGTPCLKDFRQDTAPRTPDSYCSGYQAAPQENAGAIIAKVAVSCGISPRVLLVILQKEQGLVTDSGGRLYADRYRKAMGFACPDTSGCDSTYFGFQNQIYAAARQYRKYAANPGNYGYQAGRVNTIAYQVAGATPAAFNYQNNACGTASVYIKNRATAGLYNYTPYLPNAAALGAGYGGGDACSAYGNRNFWLYFTDWFGSTQYDAAAATLPKGTLDVVSSSYGMVTVAGWTFDPDAPDQSIDVHVYVNGRPVMATTAAEPRADIAAAYPDAGSPHGYSATFPADIGNLQVCTYAINIGAGTVNPQLGCRTVDNTDPGMPVGSFDAANPVPGAIKIAGWTYDQDSTSATVTVRAYVDGSFAGDTPADATRADVAAAFGVGPQHGFDGSINTTPGSHVICLYALNVGLGIHHDVLGCRTVDVPDPAAYAPFGSADVLTANGGTAVAVGWALDRDSFATPVPVTITVDGVAAGTATTMSRPDVAARFPGAGPDQGYTWSAVLPAGSHQLCATAVNTGYGTGDTKLGCRTVTTVDGVRASPTGPVDAATGGPGTFTLVGWVYDPDAPTTPVTVRATVDGAAVGSFDAGAPRPDVARVITGIGPDHGINWTGPASAGTHQVCLTAVNVGAGSDTALGCRTVTVTDPSAPRGTLDGATVSGVTVTAFGWAFDPDEPSTPIQVHVYVDGVGRAVIADQYRPDVGAAFGVSDNHGWSWTGALATGQHEVCAYGINVGPGPGAATLGCRSVKVG